MSRHAENYTELAGYSALTPGDRLSFTRHLDDLLVGADSVAASFASKSHHGSMKRRSASDDLKLGHFKSKKAGKPAALAAGKTLDIPKLTMSATDRLSRSLSPTVVEGCGDTRAAKPAILMSSGLTVTLGRRSDVDALQNGAPQVMISDGPQ